MCSIAVLPQTYGRLEEEGSSVLLANELFFKSALPMHVPLRGIPLATCRGRYQQWLKAREGELTAEGFGSGNFSSSHHLELLHEGPEASREPCPRTKCSLKPLIPGLDYRMMS